MKKSNFFTMIELLAAVALMVLLAGIGFAGYSYAMNAAKESATKSLIAQIGAGLETIRNKHGFYPASSSALPIVVRVNTTTGLIEGIFFGIAANSVTATTTPTFSGAIMKDFLNVVDGEVLKKGTQLITTSSGKEIRKLIDRWGGDIYYRYPGAINTTKFDIVAPGPDGQFGKTPAAVPPTAIGDYQESNEWACDDIANFQ